MAASTYVPLRTVARAAVAGILVAALAGCGDDTDTGAVVSATDLAPSQVAASTVAPPTMPAGCDPDTIVAVVVEPGDGVGQPDQIVELVNEGDRECDVDISATPDAGEEMEPSVRLAPGEVGLVWVEHRGGCDEAAADPQTAFDLDVNGERVEVDLEFTAYCGVEVVAFFTD